MDKNTKKRFWDKVDKRSKDECWEWKASDNGAGYGNFWNGEKYGYAHRFSWTITSGEIPKGKYILHKCDNPPCVNPNHLFLGTQSDNLKDAYNKKRKFNPVMKGVENPNSKLTAEVIKIIRKLYKRSDLTQIDLAKEFNLSQGYINKIINKQAWQHIE